MLIAVALGIVVAMVAFPETEIGRGLKRWLVDRPAQFLARIQRGRVVFYLLLGLIGAGLIMVFETEGARLFGFMLPDTLAWFAMFDVGVFLDVFLIAAAIAAANGLRVVRAQAGALVRQVAKLTAATAGRIRLTARARRDRPTTSRPPRCDDSDAPGPSRARVWVQTPYRPFSMA